MNTLPIIGMSPGNSYFKDKEVAFLLRETIKQYDKAVIMIADEPAIATYQAMGYSFSKARSKAILKGNNLKNRTSKVLESMGLDTNHVIVVDRANDISTNSEYLLYFQRTEKLFEHNIQFKESVLQTSRAVLVNSGKKYDDISIEQATQYLLHEIAFLEFAPSYFGVSQVVYTYHKPRRVYEDYIAGVFDGETKFHLDFQLLEAPYETYLTHTERDMTRFELIKKRGKIKCAYVPYTNELFGIDGENFVGLFYDVLIDFSQKNNIKLEFVEQSGYGVLADRINAGYVDVFCAPVWPTKSRRLELFFSESLVNSNIFGYMKTDNKYAGMSIQELEGIKDLRVVVKKNDIHDDIMKEFLPHARIVRLPQLAKVGEEIGYILDNRSDIAFWEDKLVDRLLEEKEINKAILSAKDNSSGNPIKVYQNCIALPRGEFELKEMLDTSIAAFIK